MKTDAASLQQQLCGIKTEAENLLSGIDDRNFNWRASPHQWSIAQCLDHLNIFGELYFSQIENAVARARLRNNFNSNNFRIGLLAGFFLRITEPPVKTKVKAPKIFVPAPEKLIADVVPGFFEYQDRLIKKIDEYKDLDWAKVKFPSPATNLLKFNLTEGLSVITAHERRHLWQAGEVKKSPQFPLQ